MTSDFNNNFNNDIWLRYYKNLSLVVRSTLKKGKKRLEESKKRIYTINTFKDLGTKQTLRNYLDV